MSIKAECPVCKNSDEKTLISGYNYIEAAQHFCPENRSIERNNRLRTVIRNLWKQDVSYFIRCNTCGFGFGYPFIGGNEEFYQILHEQLGYPSNRWEYDITINDFFRKDPPEKIVDIGAGQGNFLQKVNCRQKYALEGSNATRNILKNLGIKVYAEYESLINEHGNSFNYVTMYQVLEHISDFNGVFETAAKLLKEGGAFVISVPDCDAMILQEQLTGCPDMVPNHINKWTPSSLERVMKGYGFKVKETIYEPRYFKKFLNAIYLKILHKASRKGSIANKIYGIKSKKVRIGLLSLYAPFVTPPLLRHYNKLSKGGSFLIRAVKTRTTL